MNNKNFIIAAVILIVISYVVFMVCSPDKSGKNQEIKVSNFPVVIGNWRGVEISLAERDYEILETRNLFVRDYKNIKGESVYLYIVYSTDNRKAMHPPEICYMGSGAEVVSKSAVKVTDNIIANKMLLGSNRKQEIVAYWFRAGSLNTEKYVTQQLKVVLNRMFGKRVSGAMIRVSTDVTSNPEAAFELIKSFCREIEPLLPKYLP